jgi:hypothetical protein
MGEKYLAMKLKDQERAIAMLAGDPQLAGLRQARAPAGGPESCLSIVENGLTPGSCLLLYQPTQ